MSVWDAIKQMHDAYDWFEQYTNLTSSTRSLPRDARESWWGILGTEDVRPAGAPIDIGGAARCALILGTDRKNVCDALARARADHGFDRVRNECREVEVMPMWIAEDETLDDHMDMVGNGDALVVRVCGPASIVALDPCNDVDRFDERGQPIDAVKAVPAVESTAEDS